MSISDILRLFSAIVVVIGIFVSARLVIKQMKLHYSLNRRTKALSYSLYSNEHLRGSRLLVEDAFGQIFDIREPIPLEKINARTSEIVELKSSILTLLAHWENMALAIHSGIADDAVCYEMVASTLIQYVKVFRNFIDDRRENNRRVYYHLMVLQMRWDAQLNDVKISEFPPVLDIGDSNLIVSPAWNVSVGYNQTTPNKILRKLGRLFRTTR